jgi:hypothetical protein
VYDGGTLNLACFAEGFQLTRIELRFPGAIKPHGWFYPTDLSPPRKHVELGVVIDKPWYSGLLPSQIKVRARAYCYATG